TEQARESESQGDQDNRCRRQGVDRRESRIEDCQMNDPQISQISQIRKTKNSSTMTVARNHSTAAALLFSSSVESAKSVDQQTTIIEGRLADIDGVRWGQIAIENGLIAAVGPNLGMADRVFSDSCLIFAGMGDIHIHAREDVTSKHNYKETFAT